MFQKYNFTDTRRVQDETRKCGSFEKGKKNYWEIVFTLDFLDLGL